MKTDKEYGLIIGRFQPPCLHHFNFINQVIHSGIKKLLIGVGDSQIIDQRNFLTAKQVISLLTPNLDLLNFSYEIKIIPDINNPPKYANHVKTFFTVIDESNTCLFTDNPYTSNCFTNYGHKFEHQTQTILPSRATDIRQMIYQKNKNISTLIPDNVFKFLLKKGVI